MITQGGAVNERYFQGDALKIYRAYAQGRALEAADGDDPRKMDALGFGPDGRPTVHKLSEDGFVEENGGILFPKVIDLRRNGVYYRFVGTEAYNAKGMEVWAGRWWIDEETFQILLGDALNFERLTDGEAPRINIAKVARRRLANIWTDCGYLVWAVLTMRLKAWVGPGKLALPGGAAAYAQGARDGLTGDAPHRALRQYYIPGTPEEIKQAFRLIRFAEARDWMAGPSFTEASLGGRSF